jgi:Domain of unknown function (DUF4852)
MMKRFILLLALLVVALPAQASVYMRPTYDNLIKTLVRYGSLELTDDQVLDEYAMVTDCDLYKAFFGNDFKWGQVRDSMRESVQLNITKFPNSYVYEDKLALDHYDFQS